MWDVFADGQGRTDPLITGARISAQQVLNDCTDRSRMRGAAWEEEENGPGSSEAAEGSFRGHRGARSCSQLRSFYSIETETLSPSVPVERAASRPPPPSPPLPLFSLLLLFPHAGLFSVEESWTLTAPPPRSQQTHRTTCPNSISNYYSTEDKRDAGKYLF